jgi:hypothetical protein
MIRTTLCTKKQLNFLLLISYILSSTTYAYDLRHALTHGHGILQLGGFWNTQGNAQHINIDGLYGDDFSSPQPISPGSGLVGVGYFIDGKAYSLFNTTYGLNWFYLGPTNRSGTVIQENLYTNLSYGYKVTNYPLYAVAKSTFHTRSPKYAMVVDAGIGPNFMKTSQFGEQSLDGITIPDHIFTGTTTTVLSATVGVSAKLNHIFGATSLECGYRFFYLGQGTFKALNNQINNNLKTGQGYANALMCGFTA